MSWPKPSYYSLNLANATQIQTDYLWDLAWVFGVLTILLVISVFYLRRRLAAKAQHIASRKRELAPIISSFLFYTDKAGPEEKTDYIEQKIEIRELLKDTFNRRVLTEILLDLRKDVSGDTRSRLLDLYQDLGLHLDAFTKLKSWRWEIISQGILELTQMQVEDSYSFIKKFINDRRGVIRKQSQLATVTLKQEGIAYFLDTTRYRISEWQQLKLLDVLRQQKDFVPPRFKDWLTSRNKDVVLFSLRLLKYYNQNDANSSLIELIRHKNDQIKIEAIQCIKEFNVVESVEPLKRIFWKVRTAVKLVVLDALASLGSEADIDFLQRIDKKSNNFIIRSKALSTINQIAPGTVLPKEGIQKYDELEESLNSELETQDIPTQKENVHEAPTEKEAEAKELSSHDEPSLDTDLAHLLDPDNEDIAIFEVCFMEELDDILSETSEITDITDPVEILPLDFLPLVENESSEKEEEPQAVAPKPQPLDIDAGAKTVDEEEVFRLELESILDHVQSAPQDPLDEEAELLHYKLLPFVFEDEDQLPSEEQAESTGDVTGLSVIFEEVSYLLKSQIMGSYKENQKQEKELHAVVGNEVLKPSVWYQLEEMKEEEDVIAFDVQIADTIEASDFCIEYDGFSIFHELFRDNDAESKLILLDEILAVGDLKELKVLISLLNDPDRRVREKTKLIRKRLMQKLKEDSGDSVSGLEDMTENEGMSIAGTENALEQDLNLAMNPLEDTDHSMLDLSFEPGQPSYDLNIKDLNLKEKQQTQEASGKSRSMLYGFLSSLKKYR